MIPSSRTTPTSWDRPKKKARNANSISTLRRSSKKSEKGIELAALLFFRKLRKEFTRPPLLDAVDIIKFKNNARLWYRRGGKISLILCFLAFYDTKAAKNITKPQNKVLLWYLRTRKMSQNPKYTAIYDMKWTLEVGQTSGVHLRYRAQIKQRKSDETRESNREAPHPNPCDLEAESCKINHLTISELKVEFRPECP